MGLQADAFDLSDLGLDIPQPVTAEALEDRGPQVKTEEGSKYWTGGESWCITLESAVLEHEHLQDAVELQLAKSHMLCLLAVH